MLQTCQSYSALDLSTHVSVSESFCIDDLISLDANGSLKL